jgi:acyl-CoA synthetase (AMP-forming)/AMP-acid ligase II
VIGQAQGVRAAPHGMVAILAEPVQIASGFFPLSFPFPDLLRPQCLGTSTARVGGSIACGLGQLTPREPEDLSAVLEGGGTGPALVCPDDGRTISRDELGAVIVGLAGRLSSLGVGRGDRVAMALANGPELIEVLLAVTALGATAAPLNPSYTEPEFRFYLSDVEPRMLLVPQGRGAAVRSAAEGIPIADLVRQNVGHPVITYEGSEVVGAPTFEPGSPEDTALVLHTSGTTSRPKQVPLLQRNLMASVRSIGAHYLLGAHDISYCAMPLFHVHGLVASTLAPLAAGGVVVTPRRFTARRFWQQARDHGVTWFSAGPTTHQMILEHFGEPLPALRFTRSCSSALQPSLMERLETAHGVPVLEAYGMTEASHQMTSNPLPPGDRLPGSVGIPAGAEVRIVDAEWREVTGGEVGEVAVRGPGLTPGYLNNPEANAESFSDGWFRTGDRGVIEGGYLRLLGRIKEMIIRGGENISPYEVEEVIRSHPSVTDAVCFGIDDEKYGQIVGAAATLAADVGVDELRDFCRESLAPFKVPEVIYIMEAIPRTATGKVQRRRLAAQLKERHA